MNQEHDEGPNRAAPRFNGEASDHGRVYQAARDQHFHYGQPKADGALRVRLAVGVAALAAVVGTGTVLAVWLAGSHQGTVNGQTGRNSQLPDRATTVGGNAAPTEPGWELSRRDVPITLQAPAATGGLSCNYAYATGFSAASLQVAADSPYAYAKSVDTFTYTNCSTGELSPYPSDVNGILLQDNQGVMDVIDMPNPTPTECSTAARKSSLPRPISLDSLRKGDLLHKGTGLCIEVPDGTLVHLLITDLRPDAGKDGLPTLVTVATQWVRKSS